MQMDSIVWESAPPWGCCGVTTAVLQHRWKETEMGFLVKMTLCLILFCIFLWCQTKVGGAGSGGSFEEVLSSAANASSQDTLPNNSLDNSERPCWTRNSQLRRTAALCCVSSQRCDWNGTQYFYTVTLDNHVLSHDWWSSLQYHIIRLTNNLFCFYLESSRSRMSKAHRASWDLQRQLINAKNH